VERVTAACGQTLASFKRPRAVRLLEEFPRVTLEKVSKTELRTMATQSR
jgi:crotonobetaine/carnitine-CoA ligase